MLIDDTDVRKSKERENPWSLSAVENSIMIFWKPEKQNGTKGCGIGANRATCSRYLKEAIDATLKKYKNATDVVWAQEEPKNMGAYSHMLMHYEKARNWRVCSRKDLCCSSIG